MDFNLPFVAGVISTVIFACSTLPMLVKAFRTRDLGSYSIGQIALANAGNAIHSIYVFHLPPGPIWLLHGFYVVSTGIMLFWYVRYEGWSHKAASARSAEPDRSAAEQSGMIGGTATSSMT